jgi:hypothetical protein
MIACSHFFILTPAAVPNKPLALDLPVLSTRSKKLSAAGEAEC